MENFLLWYAVLINLLSAIICVADKIKAVKGSWRISERTLWLFSLAGGSIGMYLAMRIVRHKTLHKRFMIGLPVLIFFQILLILLLTKYFYGHIISW